MDVGETMSKVVGTISLITQYVSREIQDYRGH